jgi:hypothetical protein
MFAKLCVTAIAAAMLMTPLSVAGACYDPCPATGPTSFDADAYTRAPSSPDTGSAANACAICPEEDHAKLTTTPTAGESAACVGCAAGGGLASTMPALLRLGTNVDPVGYAALAGLVVLGACSLFALHRRRLRDRPMTRISGNDADFRRDRDVVGGDGYDAYRGSIQGSHHGGEGFLARAWLAQAWLARGGLAAAAWWSGLCGITIMSATTGIGASAAGGCGSPPLRGRLASHKGMTYARTTEDATTERRLGVRDSHPNGGAR